MLLFHFSHERDIARFEPRPVRVPSPRPEGLDWLNDSLVWAIDAWHQSLYLFPRDCPRILVWPCEATAPADRALYRRSSPRRMIAYLEADWLEDLQSATIHRYSLPSEDFHALEDVGMWVSRKPAIPLAVGTIPDLPRALDEAGVDLRIVPSLAPFEALRATSLHVSGIRLRNRRRLAEDQEAWACEVKAMRHLPPGIAASR
jgi:hypothetical protein